MNKKLALLLAATTASTAFAAFDMRLGVASGYSLSRSGKITGTLVNGASPNVTSTGADVEGATKDSWSTTGFFGGIGGALTGMYCVMDNLFLGLSVGAQYDLAFADKHNVWEAKSGADAANGKDLGEEKEATLAAADQYGRSYLFVPIQLVLHYDIVAPMDNMNVYAELRGGWSFPMHMSTKAMKDTAHFTKDATESYGASWTFEGDLGLEYYGVGLSAGYNMKLAGQASADEDAVLKTNKFAYSHHMISVGLHYRLSNLF